MSLVNFVIGVSLLILSMFLAIAVPEVLTLSVVAEELLTVFLLFIGIAAVFIGALTKD